MTTANIRMKWLRAMYIYTAAGAGMLGVAMILAPGLVVSLLRMPPQDSTIFGVAGSTYTAFGILGLLGLRAPLRFVTILLLQMTYKVVWLLFVFLPLLPGGEIPGYTLLFAIVFISYVIGDLIAIPFRYLLTRESEDA